MSRAIPAGPPPLGRRPASPATLSATPSQRRSSLNLWRDALCDTNLVVQPQSCHVTNAQQPDILAVAHRPSELSRYTHSGLDARTPDQAYFAGLPQAVAAVVFAL